MSRSMSRGSMNPTRPSSRRSRIARLGRVAVLGTLAYVAAVLGPPWFDVFVPSSVRLRALVRLMEVARSAYVIVLLLLPAVLLALAIGLRCLRRRGSPRTWLARGLASCVALAIGMALAEGISAARLAAMRVRPPRLKTEFPDPPLRTEFPDPPLRTDFPDRPGDRTVDVVVLGESSA